MAKRKHEDQTIDGYGLILNTLKNRNPKQCPEPELLAGYQRRSLSGKARHCIEDHIAFCPLCLEALEALQRAEEAETAKEGFQKSWQAIENALDKQFRERLQGVSMGRSDKTVRQPKRNIWQAVTESVFRPKKLVYAGAFASVVVAGFYSYAFFSRADTFSLSRIKPERLAQMRAGTSGSGFNEGLQQYSLEKYGKAIKNFENFIRANPDHYAAYYYLAVSRLAHAEVGILGLPYRFDRSEVEDGMRDLEKALSLSGDNPYYTADCYWYLGKARLMLNEPDKARAWFDRIIQLDLPYPERKEEARKTIAALDRIEADRKNPR